MNRTTIIRGPAVLKKGSTVIYTEENIVVKTEVTTSEGRNAIHGKYDEFHDTVKTTITCKPAAQATAAIFALLYPYTNPVMGASIFGATPDDIVIWTKAGKQHTYKVGALTGLSGLAFAPNLPLFDGEVTFTCIGDSTEAWSATGHFAAEASVAFTDVSFDQAKDFRLHYTAAWGSTAPWNNIETEAGFKVGFDLQLGEQLNDKQGLIDMYLTGLVVTATFTPQAIAESDVLAAMGIQGTGAVRGRRIGALANNLVLSTGVVGDPTFSLFNCVLKGSATQYGVSVGRIGELALQSVLKITSGASTPVFAIGLTPEA
jgi:hypothetical protein